MRYGTGESEMPFKLTAASTRNYIKRQKGVNPTSLQARFAWLPKINTEKKYTSPWGKASLFDYQQPMKSLVADMVMYCTVVQMRRTHMFDMRSSEECQSIYSELVSTAYYKAMKGLPSWKPTYDLLGFVNNHVNFAWLGFRDEENRRNDMFSRDVPVPEDWDKGYQESMELAEELFYAGDNDGAAALYEKMAKEHPVEN